MGGAGDNVKQSNPDSKKACMHMHIGAHAHRQNPDTFKKHICKIGIILVVNLTQLGRGNLN